MNSGLYGRIKSLEKAFRPKERIIVVWVRDDESHEQAKTRALKEQNLTEEDLSPDDITIFIDWKGPVKNY